ncbi:unnamed protein product [Mesocestoides corti]|uniref:Uncharacterized protein n=1 Tax=Mesocestoides corti TaxID=53468 RepID=A0A0R3UHA1_MESCO|nr:unnamed protein product [Mesocestoides corti]
MTSGVRASLKTYTKCAAAGASLIRLRCASKDAPRAEGDLGRRLRPVNEGDAIAPGRCTAGPQPSDPFNRLSRLILALVTDLTINLYAGVATGRVSSRHPIKHVHFG